MPDVTVGLPPDPIKAANELYLRSLRWDHRFAKAVAPKMAWIYATVSAEMWKRYREHLEKYDLKRVAEDVPIHECARDDFERFMDGDAPEPEGVGDLMFRVRPEHEPDKHPF